MLEATKEGEGLRETAPWMPKTLDYDAPMNGRGLKRKEQAPSPQCALHMLSQTLDWVSALIAMGVQDGRNMGPRTSRRSEKKYMWRTES